MASTLQPVAFNPALFRKELKAFDKLLKLRRKSSSYSGSYTAPAAGGCWGNS
jgi:hypothetical protein